MKRHLVIFVAHSLRLGVCNHWLVVIVTAHTAVNQCSEAAGLIGCYSALLHLSRHSYHNNDISLAQALMWKCCFLGTLFHAHFLPLRSLQFTSDFCCSRETLGVFWTFELWAFFWWSLLEHLCWWNSVVMCTRSCIEKPSTAVIVFPWCLVGFGYSAVFILVNYHEITYC